MSKKQKSLKIKSHIVCPKCGENHYFYISKKNKKKGIIFTEGFHEGFVKSYSYNFYDCCTCGNHWEERI